MILQEVIGDAAAEKPGNNNNQYQVLLYAAGEVGIAEEPPGSNAGPVLKYGGKAGQPWCARFVCWCFREALGRYPAGRKTSTGGTGTLLASAVKAGCVFRQPEPGDIAYKPRFDGKGKRVGGHVGFIAAVSPDGKRLLSIEGNRGDAVRVQVRLRSEWTHFIRGPYTTTQPARLWLGWPGAVTTGGET